MLSVRVFFKKQGALKYISHLDLNRAVLRAFSRSELPIAFTEGFNPHPRLTFSQPLPLFCESDCEIFDFKLTNERTPEEVKAALSAALPAAFEIIQVSEPVKKLTEIYYADYEYLLDCKYEPEKFEALLEGDIIVTKKAKDKKEKTISISENIKSYSFISAENGKTLLKATLDASVNEYLNPRHISVYLESSYAISTISLKRTALYDKSMTPFK